MIILGLHPQLVPLRSLSKFNRLFALDIAIFICDWKLNVLVIVTPSSVASSTWSISSPNNWSLIFLCCLPFFLSTISCVFLAFNLILYLEHHFSRADNVLWIRYWTYVALGPNVHIARSSTNCDIFTWLFMWSTGISFTYIKNKSELRTDPLGVPALSFTLSDISSLILTVIVLSEINEDINRIILFGSSLFISLYLRPLYHTESNAFSTYKDGNPQSICL